MRNQRSRTGSESKILRQEHVRELRVVEELWIRLVATIPISNPAKGLEVISMSVSANPFPNSLKEWPNSLILKRKM